MSAASKPEDRASCEFDSRRKSPSGGCGGASGQGTTLDQPDASNAADPEAQRVQDEFARLREDAGARRAFYDDLLGTVERVRAGMRNEGSPEEKWVKFQPVEHPTRQTSSPPVSPTALAGT